jgi:hypothetical protein
VFFPITSEREERCGGDQERGDETRLKMRRRMSVKKER